MPKRPEDPQQGVSADTLTAVTKAQKQRYASFARQVGFALISVYGVLSLKDVAPHLPVWLAGGMVAATPIIQLLEHFLGDPSTGSTPAPTTEETPK